MRFLRDQRGQFIPISAMIMFTMVVFLIALVNVYNVARAKLQLQNIADAAALNLASQQAQAFNLIADKNEWLNHMVANVPSAMDPNDASNRNCEKHGGDPSHTIVVLPGISCVENTYNVGNKGMKKPKSNHPLYKRHVFQSRDGAINYGQVIHTVNQAQILFMKAYNSFLGADAGGSAGMGAAPRNFTSLLKNDIPELSDPSIRLLAWNSAEGESSKESWKKVESPDGGPVSHIRGLKFKVERDLEVRYQDARDVNGSSLGKLLYGCIDYDPGKSDYGKCGPLHNMTPDPDLGTDVGWLVPVDDMPKLKVNGKEEWGVGVLVEKTVKLPVIKDVRVRAESRAYIVKGHSGTFRPTYWVKLGT